MYKKSTDYVDVNESHKTWKKIDDFLGNKNEIGQIGIFNSELEYWHKNGLVERNENGSTVPMDIDTFIRAGRPQTWSPILDHWLIGFEAAYKADMQQEGKLLDYLIRYNIQLKQKRVLKVIND